MLVLIPAFPFVGFLINALIGRRLSKTLSGGLACLAMIASFAVSVMSVARVWGHEPLRERLFTWLPSGELQIP